MENNIRREIVINAPIQEVYAAIADPKKIVKWFPEGIEGNLEVNKQSTFIFEGHGKSSVLVVGAEPYTYFAYRWVPGGAFEVEDLKTIPNTLVEFRLKDLGTQTKVTLIESGFSLLPVGTAKSSFEDNSGGWDIMMNRLKKLMDHV